jgi:group I intron endonuclease
MVIYKITNIINNKIYIGQDKNNKPYYLGSGDLIKLSIKKYGKENFKKEILQICESQDELNYYERYYISLYDSTNKIIGYNISFGGTNGTMFNRQHSEETKNKISLSHLGKEKSDEHKENFLKSLTGKKISDETKQKMSNSNLYKGKKKGNLSEETKLKISKSKTGKKMSDEVKKKMSETRVGVNNGFYGKKHSETFMKKKRKSIIQLTLNNELIKEWESITDAGNNLGIPISNICCVLRGKYKTAGGYKFKYKDE